MTIALYKKNMYGRSILILFFVFVGFVSVSHAQWTGAMGSNWNNPISAMSNQQMWNNINADRIHRIGLKTSLAKFGCTDAQMDAMDNTQLMVALGKKSCGAVRSGNASQTATSTRSSQASPSVANQSFPTPLTFKPTGNRVLLPEIVSTLTQDKSEQTQLIQLLGGAIKQFEAAQKVKGSEYDLASAMSFFAAVSIYLQDTRTEINSKGGDALTFALREALGKKVASVTDLDKQQLYEALLTFGMLFSLSSRNASAAEMSQLKQTSAQLCQTLMGLDVSKYRFSDDGLVSVN